MSCNVQLSTSGRVGQKPLENESISVCSRWGRTSRALILSKWPGSNGDVEVSKDSNCAHLVVHDAVDAIASQQSCVMVHSERLFRSKVGSSRANLKAKKAIDTGAQWKVKNHQGQGSAARLRSSNECPGCQIQVKYEYAELKRE